jgi:hypothetical protein
MAELKNFHLIMENVLPQYSGWKHVGGGKVLLMFLGDVGFKFLFCNSLPFFTYFLLFIAYF